MNADLTQVTKDLKDSKATIVEIENTTKDLKLSQNYCINIYHWKKI